MIRWFLIITACVTFLPQPRAQEDAPSEPPPPGPPVFEVVPPADSDDSPGFDTVGERVIIQVDRHRTAMGVITEETDELISIRDRNGDPRTLLKNRIIPPIIRLVDVDPDDAPREGIVLLRNGQSRRGVVIKDGFDEVVLEIEGLPARFKREVVFRVQMLPTVQERYEQFRETVDENDPDRWLLLARWLFEEKQYELTRRELTALLGRHPHHAEARHLMNIVSAQLALQGTAREEGADDDAEEDDDDGRTGRFTPPLTEADVNLIRVYEIDFDHPPRVAVRPETVRALIGRYSDSDLIPASRTERQAMFRAEPLEIVQTMFRLQARELYPEVMVRSEPRALNMFRQRVHNAWLMNNCVTSRCHSGPPDLTAGLDAGPVEGGRFQLIRRRMNDPRVRYANLLLLERTVIDPAWPLINYERPLDSLIIQHGLPRADARRPHPDVPGWKPVFPRADHRMVQQTIGWIDAMMQPRPDYPIDYPPTPDDFAQPDTAE